MPLFFKQVKVNSIHDKNLHVKLTPAVLVTIKLFKQCLLVLTTDSDSTICFSLLFYAISRLLSILVEFINNNNLITYFQQSQNLGWVESTGDITYTS